MKVSPDHPPGALVCSSLQKYCPSGSHLAQLLAKLAMHLLMQLLQALLLLRKHLGARKTAQAPGQHLTPLKIPVL